MRVNFAVSQNIHDWKGQDITDFQEDLSRKVNGRISEKWFYTHLKNESQKLPRIDLLNLLSNYSGYKNWADFKQQTTLIETTESKPSKKRFKPFVLILVLALTLITTILLLPRAETYEFCFVDADRGMPIHYPIEIIELKPNESPLQHPCNSNGCFSITTHQKSLSFIVNSPYYQTDTIKRTLTISKQETIKLKTNDYALMIHVFSNSNVNDWKKRRQQLDNMLANHAEIYQIDHSEGISIELYNKTEFINKLTMPINSLKHIEVLETIYEGHQIVKMRFRQVPKK